MVLQNFQCKIIKPKKKNAKVRRPGIEPGAQEWESCMLPLHQRRFSTIK
jgi:hypothetical protein